MLRNFYNLLDVFIKIYHQLFKLFVKASNFQ